MSIESPPDDLKVLGAPARYVQGQGATRSLGRELNHLGIEGPAQIIASAIVIEQLADTWSASLGAEDIEFEVRTFGGECSKSEIDAGLRAGRSCGATVIIGAGGGKCLDTARAVAGELGLPQPSDTTLAAIAERAVATGETAHNEPFEVTAAMIHAGMVAANALGHS